jgi:hypothetical protein
VAFVKGQSGNPGGRSRGFERMARERWAALAGSDEKRVDEYVGFLRTIMLDDTQEPRDRIAAAKLLKETGDGKAREIVETVQPQLTDDEINAELEMNFQERLAALSPEERLKLLADPAPAATIQ